MNRYLQKIISEIDIKNQVFSFTILKGAYQCVLEKDIDLFIVDIILNTSLPGDSSGLKFVAIFCAYAHFALIQSAT